MKRVLFFLKDYKLQLVAGPFFKLLEAILELYVPYRLAGVIDNSANGIDRGYIIKEGVTLLAIIIIGYCFALICQWMGSKASQGFGTSLRDALYEKSLCMSHKAADKFSVASLINRITADVNTLQLSVAMLIRVVVRAPFLCIGGVVMAFVIDYRLALIAIITIPIFIGIVFLIMKKAVPIYKKLQDKLDRMELITRENLSGVRVIRAFVREKKEKERFADSAEEHAQKYISAGKVSMLLNPLTQLVMNTVIVAVLYMTGFSTAAIGITSGELIAFINYINIILASLLVVANIVTLYTRAYASALRASAVLETDNDLPVMKNGSGKSEHLIEFKGVSFSYGGEKVLEEISFHADRGETIGIIGGTGAGKTTLVHLMTRFYDPTEGEVLFEGEDIRTLIPVDYRKKIAVIPQKVVLFSGTIEENISFSSEEEKRNAEGIREAARMAQADSFISERKEGYCSVVERGGRNFSGGQRQRIAIARAFAKKSSILVLDDATSALDFSTDAAVRKEIQKNKGNKAIFIISQRVGTIMNADRILLLKNGVLLAQGSHSELISSCSEYKEICLSQGKF